MKRSHLILGGLLVLQVAILLVLRSPWSGEATAAAVQPLIPELESMTATKVRVEAGDGQSVDLERQGGAWVLPGAGGYPVEPDKVRQLLDDLKGLRARRPVVTSPRYHANLKVTESDHERRVQVWDGEGDNPDVDLLVGTSPNYRISHVRRQGQDEVFEVMGLSPWDLRTDRASWIQRKLVDVPFDSITGMRLENAHGTIEVRKAGGQWTLAGGGGPELDQGKVDSLVRSFAALYLAEPAGRLDPAVQGLSEPVAVVELIQGGADGGEGQEATGSAAAQEGTAGDPGTAAAGETAGGTAGAGETGSPPPARERITVVRIGGEIPDGDGKRYATRGGFDFAVVLNKVDAERATGKKLSDLRPDA